MAKSFEFNQFKNSKSFPVFFFFFSLFKKEKNLFSKKKLLKIFLFQIKINFNSILLEKLNCNFNIFFLTIYFIIIFLIFNYEKNNFSFPVKKI